MAYQELYTSPFTPTLSLQGRGKSMSPRPSVGGKLILPADQGGGPGEPAADRGETDQIARFDPARPHRGIQRQRERRRGGVPIPLNQIECTRRLNAQPLPYFFQQPSVGLMKEEAADVGHDDSMFL